MAENWIKEAECIGDWLIKTSINQDQGIAWKTHRLAGDQVVWLNSPTIYNGNSGIALFFLQLYRLTGNEEYRRVSELALESACHNLDPPEQVGVLTGRSSLIMALVRSYEVAGDEKCLRQAHEICCQLPPPESIHTMDFIGGLAGMTIGLALLLHYSPTEELMVTINNCIHV